MLSIVSAFSSLYPFFPLVAFRRIAFHVPISSGVESSLSMDEVLRKRYRGKLEHREVDLVDLLPPPRRMDRLALTVAPSVSPVSGSASEMDPLHPCHLSAVMPLIGTRASSLESSEYSKEAIIADVQRMQAKRKAILAMGEPVVGASNVAKRV